LSVDSVNRLIQTTLSTDPKEVCVHLLCPDNDQIDSVFLNYSVDNSDFIKILLEQSDSITWCGFIPGQIKGTKIALPRSPEDCNKIFRTLQHDFDKYSSQIKAMLKTYRSKAHYISIYRDLVMGRG